MERESTLREHNTAVDLRDLLEELGEASELLEVESRIGCCHRLIEQLEAKGTRTLRTKEDWGTPPYLLLNWDLSYHTGPVFFAVGVIAGRQIGRCFIRGTCWLVRRDMSY